MCIVCADTDCDCVCVCVYGRPSWENLSKRFRQWIGIAVRWLFIVGVSGGLCIRRIAHDIIIVQIVV